jgi:hypothetical protein
MADDNDGETSKKTFNGNGLKYDLYLGLQD